MRIEFNFGPSGYFRHYINGVLAVNWTGQVGDGSGQYPKAGFNGGFDNNVTEAQKSNIRYDNWIIYKLN